MTSPFQENIESTARRITTQVDNTTAQVENATKAAEAVAISRLNAVKTNVVESAIKAIPKPSLPEIPQMPQIPSMPKLPAIPTIPAIPNLEFSVPSMAVLLKKLLPKVTLPSFSFKVEIPKFKMPARPDWKGPPKIEPPKLPTEIPGLASIMSRMNAVADQVENIQRPDTP